MIMVTCLLDIDIFWKAHVTFYMQWYNAASFLPKNEADLEKFVAGFRNASAIDVQKIMTDPIVLTKKQENFL